MNTHATDFALVEGSKGRSKPWIVSGTALLGSLLLVWGAICLRESSVAPDAQYGLGEIQYDSGSVPFSYFSTIGVVIVIVDDVLKYYKGNGGRSAGQSGGYGCPEPTTVCLHGQSDRSCRQSEEDEWGASSCTFDIPVYGRYEILVFPNRTFTMSLNGKTFTSEDGNVFLISTLYQYSVQPMVLDFGSVVGIQDKDILEAGIADLLKQEDAVYEFATVAIEENAQWDEENEYINRFF